MEISLLLLIEKKIRNFIQKPLSIKGGNLILRFSIN